jgi:hypothetical protein
MVCRGPPLPNEEQADRRKHQDRNWPYPRRKPRTLGAQTRRALHDQSGHHPALGPTYQTNWSYPHPAREYRARWSGVEDHGQGGAQVYRQSEVLRHSEDELVKAVEDGVITKGEKTVIVLRYLGPRGGPGTVGQEKCHGKSKRN